MYYDFVEIGTSDFDTLIESSNETSVGLSIEPIGFYLDKLPNRPFVKKVNCAISNYCGEVDVYYIEPEDVEKYKFGYEARGCNSIGEPHLAHKIHIANGLSHIVKSKKVEVIDWKELVKRYDIDGIKLLKIDTEGHDVVILNNMFDDYEHKILPKTIFFEANILTKDEDVQFVLDRASAIGYDYRRDRSGQNIILKKK